VSMRILNRLHSLSVLPHPLLYGRKGLEASQPTANLEGVQLFRSVSYRHDCGMIESALRVPKTHELLEPCRRGRVCELDSAIDRREVKTERQA